MTKKISGLQAGLILALSTISLKFLVYPSIFAKYAYRDVYVPMLLGLVFDFLCTALMLYIINKNPNVKASQLLERAFGKIVTKIIYFVLFIRFFVKGIIAIKEVHNYFNEALFDNINWFVYMFPLFLLSAFMILKDFRTFGRTIQFFLPFIVASLIFTICVPAFNADFSNILPVFEHGTSGIAKALYYCVYTFGDYFVLFLLMGNIDYKPSNTKTILTTLLITDIVIVAFYIIFACVFKDTGLNRSLAISELLLYTNINTATGTINWVNILVWLIIMFLQVGLMLHCSSVCLEELFCFKNKYVPMSIVIVLGIVVVSYLYLSLMKILTIVTYSPVAGFAVAVQILLPLIIFIAHIKVSKNHKFKLIDVYNKKIVKYQLTDITGGVSRKKKFSLKNNGM